MPCPRRPSVLVPILVVVLVLGISRAAVASAVQGRSAGLAETPAAPVHLAARRYWPHVELHWRHTGHGVIGFEIERATGSDRFARVGAVARTARTYRDETVRRGQTYLYRVRAIADGTASAYSEELLVGVRGGRR